MNSLDGWKEKGELSGRQNKVKQNSKTQMSVTDTGNFNLDGKLCGAGVVS